MKILFFGDIVGKIGRKGVAQVVAQWRKEHDIDVVIANGENMAHGKGFNQKSLDEMQQAGVDFFTLGNHFAKNNEGLQLLQDKSTPVVRPANFAADVPGVGYRIIEVGATSVAIINIMGQVFLHENVNSPFQSLDTILQEIPDHVAIKLVDFHAEATSEKVAFGWYADGKVSAVVGTHTHVPTADARVLPHGTAYVTDIGMCGAQNSVIGTTKESIVAQFVDQLPRKHDIPEDGPIMVSSVVLDIARDGKATSIERLDTVITE